MQFDELAERYGVLKAELIRQAMTLDEFHKYEIEELVPYFELKAERLYDEYRFRLNLPAPEGGPLKTQEEYIQVLRRRWEEADEMARNILDAERAASEHEFQGTEVA